MPLHEKAKKWLAQVDFRCLACGADLTVVKWQLDHIHPRSRGGSDDPANFQILCASCNGLKGAKTMREWAPHLFVDGKLLVCWHQLGWSKPEQKEGLQVIEDASRRRPRFGHSAQFGRWRRQKSLYKSKSNELIG